MKVNITGQSSSGGGYATIQDEGTPLTQRTTVNFAGAGVSAADSGGITVVTIPGGAGSGATGTATLDFGAFPGTSDASIAVTGQASIVSGSIVNAWIRPVASADHSADEHMLETLKIFAGNIVAATGFTIYGFNTSERNEPIELIPNANSIHQANATTIVNKNAQPADKAYGGGKGTRIYGTWTIAWKWE